MADSPTLAGSPTKRVNRPLPAAVDTTITIQMSDLKRPSQAGTEPDTPLSPHLKPESPIESSGLFHNYLRAIYPFDSSVHLADNDNPELMTANIKPGDLVLVHSIHANGWADGTVLTSGERGWLPTGYCEPYSHPYLRNLLNALTQFWDLLGSNEDVNLATFIRQDYIRGLIAGVRHLLERADCLHRDSGLVQKHNSVRRQRKGLLADLSSMVQIAKRLQETAKSQMEGEVVDGLLYSLITKAFKVVTRAVTFLDVWTRETVEAKPKPQEPRSKLSAELPRTPPSEEEIAQPDSAVSPKTVELPVDSAKALPKIQDDESSTLRRVSTESAQANTRSLMAAVKSRKGSVAHRMSMIITDNHSSSNNLASNQLTITHDICLGHIGTFLGHRMNARPTSGFVGSTERLVKACRTMLAVVDEVYTNDTQGSMGVYEAKERFRSKLEELVNCTKEAFRFSDLDDDDETEVVMFPDQSNRLVSAGTSLIRTASECFTKIRSLIEQIGDFELQESLPMIKELHRGSFSTTPLATTTEEQAEAGAEAPEPPLKDEQLAGKMLPPPPPNQPSNAPSTEAIDFATASNSISEGFPPSSLFSPGSRKSLPQLPIGQQALVRASMRKSDERTRNSRSSRTQSASPVRKDSVGLSIAGSMDTVNSVNSEGRDSAMTVVSEVSTRATTPDMPKPGSSSDPGLFNSFASLSSLQSGMNDSDKDAESQLLQKTYASELILNRDGQVTGGSLPALVEQLTLHDAAPDSNFVSAFYITFRMFTTPRDFTKALVDRFEYIGDSKTVGTPVRLRVYNIFKGWLETYWDPESDNDALADIGYFAVHNLRPHLNSVGERLLDLTRRVAEAYNAGQTSVPLVSGVGKTSMCIGSNYDTSAKCPEPSVTKSQLNMLRAATSHGGTCHITDLDPLEIARQLTILASKIFCEIQPHELLGLEWTKKNPACAPNVRRMGSLNTDLAHVVNDTILGPEEAKKRAGIIKHWTKIAMHCLELNNYDSLVAIMCTLNSSSVQRLKQTWTVVSKSTMTRLEDLNRVVDHSRNQASLRSRLETPVVPCLPFVGMYLTDLTFVDAGNPNTREIPGSASETGDIASVINFDKYMRTAKIISHLQRFQTPYKLQTVNEMQAWMESHMKRMRAGNESLVGSFHRRSLIIEPKNTDFTQLRAHSVAEDRPKTPSVPVGEPTVREKFGTFFRQNPLKRGTAAADV